MCHRSVAATLSAVLLMTAALPRSALGADASHWAWGAVRPTPPPDVAHPQWPKDPLDRFVLARLEQNGLEPASEADRRTLIRRVSFTLIGLPPTPAEVQAFLQDTAPDAYERVVDRLLASDRFGERWARHWMDLVRYADTLGNESDAPIPNAWRYRDYLIRAFNADVPYDRLAVEHIAGDLLPHPRRHPREGLNESIIGTGFFWFNEGKRSPVDVRQAQADCFDNKIDVLCKTFLGLTVACARCHDHKFDPITQADYYALYGYLKSSRYTQAMLNRDVLDVQAAALRERKTRIREAAASLLLKQSKDLSRFLIATTKATTRPAEAVTAEVGLPLPRLKQWIKALMDPATESNPMYAWVRLAELGANSSPEVMKGRLQEIREAVTKHAGEVTKAQNRVGDIPLSDFDRGGFAGWFSEDQAFGEAPLRPGDFLPGQTAERPVAALVSGGAWAHSGGLSRRLQGTLRSPNFRIHRRYLHVYAAGRAARINVNVEHFVMIQDPLYGALRHVLNDDTPHWHTFDLGLWKGCRAYVEFADTTTPDLHDMAGAGCGEDGYLTVGRVLLSDQGPPPDVEPPPATTLIERPLSSLRELAERYQSFVRESLEAFGAGTLQGMADADARAAMISWMIRHGLLDTSATDADGEERDRLSEAMAQFHQIETSLPAPIRVPATVDGPAEDEYVFLRGNHKTPGPVVGRRMIHSIADEPESPPKSGSGRLRLAHRFIDRSNPFFARVIVNRVWHHLIGRGIVASVDNFGALGDVPTHPELLDYLADGFVRDGYSIKHLVRRIALSATFRMSSRGDACADEKDPDDKLLHRALARRLEGEAIRDQILQVSGRLDTKMYGPGVEVFLTPFLLGNYTADYGRPKESGPLDGDGRRSIYQMVRRNFLPPMMVAFDTPPPINTAGRRLSSNVPAQALILMNDPFVIEQAKLWAQRVISDKEADAAARIRRMYEEAYCRPPTDAELEVALHFLEEDGHELGIAHGDRQQSVPLWSDLAHVMMNAKEFVFVH